MFAPVLLTDGHTNSVNSLSLCENLLASGGDDGNVFVWSPEESPRPVSHVRIPDACSAVKFNPGNRNILYTAHKRTLFQWDVRQFGVALNEWNVNEDEVNYIDVLNGEDRLAAADDSGSVIILDTSDGSLVRSLKKHDNICSVAMFRPGRSWQLISGGLDCRMIVTDWKSSGLGVNIFELSELVPPPFHNAVYPSTVYYYPPEDPVPASSQSHSNSTSDHQSDESTSDNDRSGDNNFPCVIGLTEELADGEQLPSDTLETSDSNNLQSVPVTPTPSMDTWGSTLPINPPMVHSIACSPSGDLVATGLERCSVEIFEGHGKRLSHVKSLVSHQRAVSAVHFLNETHLLSGGNDRNLFLWVMESDCVCHRIRHSNKINSIQGREEAKVYIADCSPAIQMLNLSVC